MSDKKTKLELTWIGKDNRPQLEPRILLEDPSLSHAAHGMGGIDHFDNLLIHGDNLLALRSLEQSFAGKVRCAFIDPPYNTGAAFAQYEDGIEHSIWLSLMCARVEVLHRLLSPDGSLWVTLDDHEAHYFKVMVDSIFGRDCFIADIAWQKRDGAPNDRKIGSVHDHILVWGRSRSTNSNKTLAELGFNLMPRTEKADAQYKVFPEPGGPDPRGAFRKIDATANGKGGRMVDSLVYPVTNPFTGEQVWPRKGTCWRHSRAEMERLNGEGRLYWGVNGTAGTPMRKLYRTEAKPGMTAPTIWTDAGLNQHASAEMEAIFGEKASFETPKPEALLERIIHIATNPGEVVLDSFLGSGTTAAVAHKMRRRWIGIEMGPHAVSHVVPRLVKVVNGRDPGGATESAAWTGGGGFRFLRLAPSLLARDKWGNYVISETYRKGPDAGARLAEAMCKLEGFTYAPSPSTFWVHGTSTERDFIYVTTQTLTHEQLVAISEDVGADRTLLICCGAFVGKPEQLPNLTVKKIPAAVLSRCEWGKDDYSLNVAAVTGQEPAEPDAPSAPGQPATPTRRKKPVSVQELSLFSAPRGDK